MKAKRINTDFEIQFKSIELLNVSLKFYSEAAKGITNFKYILSIETRTNEDEKLIFKIVNVQIQDLNQTITYGSVVASCVFYAEDFSALVKVDKQGEIYVLQNINAKLDSMSVSTLRGLMFAEFKGSFLHNAILPVMEF